MAGAGAALAGSARAGRSAAERVEALSGGLAKRLEAEAGRELQVAVGIPTSLPFFVVRKKYQTRERSKRLVGWVRVQICTTNLYSYPFVDRACGKKSKVTSALT